MSRLLPSASLIRDQVDYYNPSGSTNRAIGITFSQITLQIFVDNSKLLWPIVDGTLIADSSISAGNVYLNEIPGSPGYYSIRFFPDKIGFWKLSILNTTLNQEITKEYDIVPAGTFGPTSSGLNASFFRP